MLREAISKISENAGYAFYYSDNNTINLYKKLERAISLPQKAMNSRLDAICENFYILAKIDRPYWAPFLCVPVVIRILKIQSAFQDSFGSAYPDYNSIKFQSIFKESTNRNQSYFEAFTISDFIPKPR